jgi:LDH2 family malate/lactate/ureidoglycolate dehydrogenase
MATSIVPAGKITVYRKAGLPIPYGWAIDQLGQVTTDPAAVFAGGALLPLGGTEEMRGYKGYGLALLVDILCGVLAGSAFGLAVDSNDLVPSRIGHCFAALRVDAFRPLAEFKSDMDALIRQLKNAPKALGQERIYIPGEKEFEHAERARREGVPILAEVVQSLIADGAAAGIPFDLQALDIIQEMEV